MCDLKDMLSTESKILYGMEKTIWMGSSIFTEGKTHSFVTKGVHVFAPILKSPWYNILSMLKYKSICQILKCPVISIVEQIISSFLTKSLFHLKCAKTKYIWFQRSKQGKVWILDNCWVAAASTRFNKAQSGWAVGKNPDRVRCLLYLSSVVTLPPLACRSSPTVLYNTEETGLVARRGEGWGGGIVHCVAYPQKKNSAWST